MSVITCTRRLGFDAGHRVMGHEGKCASWHGHTYGVELTAEAEALDRVGRVIDFSVLKEKVGGWLDRNWDHAMIVCDLDGAMVHAAEILAGPKLKTSVVPFNPTAENMADYLLQTICPLMLEGTGVQVVEVVVHETPNCRATARLEIRKSASL